MIVINRFENTKFGITSNPNLLTLLSRLQTELITAPANTATQEGQPHRTLSDKEDEDQAQWEQS